MKPPISIGKKYIGKMSTEKTNQSNTLESSVMEEKQQVIEDSISTQQENNTLSSAISDHLLSYIKAKTPPTQNLQCPENSNNCGSLESIDTDNKSIGTFKRVSLDRSLSFDDSGFNSCTSDDRDELSERLSLDLAFLSGDEDENAKILRQIPSRLRQRSYSLDSESSDYSDSHFSNTKSWSSSANYLDLSKNLLLWRDSNIKLFTEDSNSVKLRNKLVKRSVAQKTESVSNVTDTPNTSIPLVRPAIQRRRRAVKDHHNNRQSGSVVKNLKSYQNRPSPCINHCFKDHGLLTLISCVFYTLFLGFIVGVCGLLFQVFKSFVNKDDLEDLRKSVVSKSRPSEKQLSGMKENGVLTQKRKNRE